MEILTFPNPILRRQSKPVDNVTDEIRDILLTLHDTMIEHDGIGLAAPQIGISQQMFVIDLRAGDGPIWFVNPEITQIGTAFSSMKEGCLSVPGAWGEVVRSAAVKISFTDFNGQKQQLECVGLMSAAVQHEHDHLQGLFHLDRMVAHERRRAMHEAWPELAHAASLGFATG